MNSAKTGFDSPAGLIETEWKRMNGKLSLAVTVPPNTSATLYFPSKKISDVYEKCGKALRTEEKNGKAIFKMNAGNYFFTE